jgi:four helix bundle protein
MFRFEKLDVWQMAVEFADRVYDATNRFPENERFGLTSQMRRSAVSVSSNIAEGTGRRTDTDFARFLEIAYGSLMEVVSQIEVARRQRILSSEDHRELYEAADRLARMLSGLRSSLSIEKMKRPIAGPRPSTLDARPKNV